MLLPSLIWSNRISNFFLNYRLMDFKANVLVICDNEGAWEELNVFSLNAETTEFAQLEDRWFLALLELKESSLLVQDNLHLPK